MTVSVRLFATLRNGRGKELKLDFEERANVRDIIEKLDIPKEEVAILLINGRTGTMDRELTSTDIVSLFPPVGGG